MAQENFLESRTPIGVFDSGIGGLGVLRALMAELPHEHFVYMADNAHAPYGERGEDFVLERARVLARRLLQEHAIKALVVACNTATAAAVRALRAELGPLPIVGIEPALKPAAAASRTKHIGVLATRGTLQSAKFHELLHGLDAQARFHLQACDGLADAIEKEAAGADCARTAELIGLHIAALGQLGRAAGQIDTLVLGCTHYPLVWPLWEQRVAGSATLLDPSAAVARRCRQVLAERNLLHPPHPVPRAPLIRWQATGSPQTVQAAITRWVSVGVL